MRATADRRALGLSLLALGAALSSGCLSQARRQLRVDAELNAHYQREAIPGASVEQLDALLNTLPSGEPWCLSVRTPCAGDFAAPTAQERRFCLRWGDNASCYLARQLPAGLEVRSQAREVEWEPLNRWLFEALDPSLEVLRSAARARADEEVSRSEQRTVSVNTFWAQARLAGAVPTFGFQVQGGYRRWLSQYLLVSVGGGYERGLIAFSGGAFRRDSVLLTARVELSSYDEAFSSRWLGLPLIAGHLGFTAVVGVGPTAGWAMRGFVGFSCSLVPLAFELGVANDRVANSSDTGLRFYLAAGLGL